AGMGRVRNALRALALTDPRPAAVLAGLDRLFAATELDEQVTTVAYLVFDPGSGGGVAGNAGPPPPPLLCRGAPPPLEPPPAAAGSVRAGDAAGLAKPAPAVRLPAASGPHGGAVLRRPGGEPAPRAALRPGRTGGRGRAGGARGGGGSRQAAGIPG